MTERLTQYTPMMLRLLLCWIGFFFLTTTACQISKAPDTRGWQCNEDLDCTNGLGCSDGLCRARCLDDSDCVGGESCLADEYQDKYCQRPCRPGTTRACYPERYKNTRGKGDCRDGTQRCSNNYTWGSCTGAITPKQEVCEGKSDENCDGTIDEGCTCPPGTKEPCYAGSPSTKDLGLCKSGTKTCINGKWGSCEGQVLPQEEECDGKDNNCNGKIDEDIKKGVGKSCTVSQKKGPCKFGKSACSDGSFACQQTNFPQDEECNGKDDDCDGQVDNAPNKGNSTLKRACYLGSKGCTLQGNNYKCTSPCNAGVQTCQGGGWLPSCDGQVTPTDEVCDNKDNDCDGQIDNNLSQVGQACDTKKEGICKIGTYRCKAGNLQCEQNKFKQNADACDGKDNDCNGKIDDGCPTGQSCNGGKCQ